MTITDAIQKAYALHTEWVGERPQGRGFDLDRIQASIRQEIKWNKQRPMRSTPACARETRGKAILLGKIRKALNAE